MQVHPGLFSAFSAKLRFSGKVSADRTSLPIHPKETKQDVADVDTLILSSDRAKEIGNDLNKIPPYSGINPLKQYVFDDDGIAPEKSILFANKEGQNVRFYTIYDRQHPCAVVNYKRKDNTWEADQLIFSYKPEVNATPVRINPISARAFLMMLFNVPTQPLKALTPEAHQL